jgi:hypothetical protein
MSEPLNAITYRQSIWKRSGNCSQFCTLPSKIYGLILVPEAVLRVIKSERYLNPILLVGVGQGKLLE